jgi:hypothetical protein
MPLRWQIHLVAYDRDHAGRLDDLNANLFAFVEICSTGIEFPPGWPLSRSTP